MGTRTDEIEREIALERQRISRRYQELQSRLDDDMDQARQRASSAVSTATHTATEKAQQLSDKTPLGDIVGEHPLTSVLGAFGLGILLGVTTDRAGGKQDQRFERLSRRDGGRRPRNSILDELVDMSIGAVGSSFSDEIRQFVRQTLGRDGTAPQQRPEGPYAATQQEGFAYGKQN